MQKKNFLSFIPAMLFCLLSTTMFGIEVIDETSIKTLIEIQNYGRAIHVMFMLLIGFGFLMVFVKKYGLSALTATYMLVSIAIPVYFLIDSMKIFVGSEALLERIILSEFSAASLLIAAGAILGRVKIHQYMILGLMFVFVYAFNEWVLLKNGLGLIPFGNFVDTGGSIAIHAFGAFFGIGAAFMLTTLKEFQTPIESDHTSDRFSMLGSMALWIFWPSFCSALVKPEMLALTVTNVILALCGSTLATYFASVIIRKKISIADIANASLAGGVAIGATCDKTGPVVAFIIGICAGLISTVGFAIVQSKLQNLTKKIDTCGVLNLHGFPGLFGGLVSILVVAGIDAQSQLLGIGFTIVVALVAGLIAGKIVSLFGQQTVAYDDSEEF